MEDKVTKEFIDASGVVVIARTAEDIESTGEVYVVNSRQLLNNELVRVRH
jgi:hypothetical protein